LGIAEAAVLPFFALLLSDRGMAPDAIGIVLALTAVAGFAASPAWGYAADRRLGPERAIALAQRRRAPPRLFLSSSGRTSSSCLPLSCSLRAAHR
jgi:MFS family permease